MKIFKHSQTPEPRILNAKDLQDMEFEDVDGIFNAIKVDYNKDQNHFQGCRNCDLNGHCHNIFPCEENDWIFLDGEDCKLSEEIIWERKEK